MTDLAERIMKAWLDRNPEPKGCKVTWTYKHAKLRDMLGLSAYESAVIQFLVPKGMTYQLGNYLFIEGGVYGQNICCESNSGNPAESLFNAIESARLK